ncbi:MAG TPA: ABC transporter permease [Acidobacteriota bacterium]|nr:ABC transporter permease [Acidobacteriota bacterium]HNT17910.1 ABC transporter permease [Acidobacteriota bacterium]
MSAPAIRKDEIFGLWGTFVELVRVSLRAIMASKMRSFLTVLGIIIGVLAVVTVLSIIQGVFASFFQEFETMGADTMFIRPNYEMFKSHVEGIRRLKMTYEDAVALGANVKEVKEVAPFLMASDSLAYRGKKDSTQIIGTTESYLPVNNLGLDAGRFISSVDVSTRRKVCVIGRDIIDKLALPEECLGEEIQIGRGTYTIIGIQEKKGGSFGQSQDDIIYIPLTTGVQQYGQAVSNQVFMVVQVRDVKKMDDAVDRISTQMRKQHGLKFGQEDDFRIFTVEQVRKIIKQFTSISTMVVTAIVSITLIVGGIGIMNIMLVSVTERTREIGIRMAVGAKRTHILYQFLLESVTLSTLGGIIGLATGYGLAHFIVFILRKSVSETFPPAYVPLWVVALSLLFAALTGAVFGVYPAYKASRLDPIDALRYE